MPRIFKWSVSARISSILADTSRKIGERFRSNFMGREGKKSDRIGSMSGDPKCPKCAFEYPYEQGEKYVCPECSHEWPIYAQPQSARDESVPAVKDANGNLLKDGDSVTVIKDLKVKGSSVVVKVGTKVRNIRLVEGDHNIDCKIDGIGAMKLKSEFVRKI